MLAQEEKKATHSVSVKDGVLVIEEINDSKKLTEKKREKLFDVIIENYSNIGKGGD